jgi:hypothetical protein
MIRLEHALCFRAVGVLLVALFLGCSSHMQVRQGFVGWHLLLKQYQAMGTHMC